MATITSRASRPGSAPSYRSRRRGSITPFVLVSLGVLIAALAVAVDYCFLWQTRVEMQISGDAASLAAAQALVDDDFLTGNPVRAGQRIQLARLEAIRYGQINPAAGRPVDLLPGVADGDITFGFVLTPRSRNLAAVDPDGPATPAFLQVNTVRVLARRTRARGNPATTLLAAPFSMGTADIVAAATATLDRDVIGFRPLNGHVLPLAPIALFADPSAVNPLSWNYQIENQGVAGVDAFRFDRATRTFVPDASGDGIREMAVEVSTAASGNGCLLLLGTTGATDAADQLLNGVEPSDLTGLGGSLVLDPTNRLSVPSTVAPTAPSPGFNALQTSLDALRITGEPRIWPLYVSCDDVGGTSVLAGFVAARVVLVGPANPGDPLTFTLQPASVSEPASVTDATRRGVGGVAIYNPYIAKVRQVE